MINTFGNSDIEGSPKATCVGSRWKLSSTAQIGKGGCVLMQCQNLPNKILCWDIDIPAVALDSKMGLEKAWEIKDTPTSKDCHLNNILNQDLAAEEKTSWSTKKGWLSAGFGWELKLVAGYPPLYIFRNSWIWTTVLKHMCLWRIPDAPLAGLRRGSCLKGAIQSLEPRHHAARSMYKQTCGEMSVLAFPGVFLISGRQHRQKHNPWSLIFVSLDVHTPWWKGWVLNVL